MSETLAQTWEEWQQGYVLDHPPLLPRRMRNMLGRYGKSPGEVCGNCAKLIRVKWHDKTYPKCDLTVWSHGAGTDWRHKWPACGAFERREK